MNERPPPNARPIDAYITLHTGEPGAGGRGPTLVKDSMVRATRCLALFDAYGIREVWVWAHWDHITATGVTHYATWGDEDGTRFIATGRLVGRSGPLAGRPLDLNGSLTIESLEPAPEPA